MKFLPLYKKSKTGKILVWDTWVEGDSKTASINVKSGQVGGKLTIKQSWIRTGTNVGRSNEMDCYEKACFDTQNNWKDKFEDNYVTDVNDIDKPWEFIYPMLATPIKKLTKSLSFPCYVQPKLNGMRAFSLRTGLPDMEYIGHNDLMSRERENLTVLTHISKACDDVFGRHTNHDGEIYQHGVPLQDIIGMCKKNRPGLTNKLEYWVYDIPMTNLPFCDRLGILESVIPDNHHIIKKTPTHLCQNQDDVNHWKEFYISNGFEGIIIRTYNGLYGFNDRTTALIKDKNFQDEEFEIIGVDSEEFDDNGTIYNLVIWLCSAGKGTFKCRPKGTVLQRSEWFRDSYLYIGKQLTVRYLEKSKDGIPIGNPVGEAIRFESLKSHT